MQRTRPVLCISALVLDIEDLDTPIQSSAISDAPGAKIEFSVGLSSAARASVSRGMLTQLADAGNKLLQKFSTNLNAELTARGAAAVNLSAGSLVFTKPSVVVEKTKGGTT